MNVRVESEQFLRRALIADAVVSGLCGLALVTVPGLVAKVVGLESPGIVLAVGASFVVYATVLLRNVRRDALSRGEAMLAVGLNVASVVACAVVIAARWLTTEGNWAVALIGDVVLLFAILQAIGLRKMSAATA